MKILISSDCNGRFSTLFTKVSQLHSKNHFDCLFLLGSVCPSNSSKQIAKIIQKQLKVDLPTYFIDTTEMSGVFSSLHPNGYQISDNFEFLGAYGVRKVNFLTVAYLNGVELGGSEFVNLMDKEIPLTGKFYNQKTISKLIELCGQYPRIDVLLTNQWAYQYLLEANHPKSKLVSKLVESISPRYHFAAGGQSFFRMDPFESSKGHPTHFINVAPIINDNPTGKYLFAIKIEQQTETVIMKPSPFTSKYLTNQQQMSSDQKLEHAKRMVEKSHRKNVSQQNKPDVVDTHTHIYFENFSQNTHNSEIIEFLQRWGEISTIQIFDPRKHKKAGVVKFRQLQSTQICLKDTGKYSMHNQRIRFKISNTGGRKKDDQCWFCLGTKVFNDTLMIYKGNHCYMSMDKGPIVDNHLQLIPFSHQSHYQQLSKQQASQIDMFRKILISHYNNTGKTVILYSRYANISDNINHWIEHILPVDKTQKQLVEKFKEMNIRDKLWFKSSSIKNADLKHRYHAVIQIGKTCFIKQLQKRDRKDILRQAVCIILDNISAINWKDSERSPQTLKKDKERISNQIKMILSQ